VKKHFKSGVPMIWITGGSVAISLILVLGVLALIAVRGLGHFWPSALVQVEVTERNGEVIPVLGEVHDTESVARQIVADLGYEIPEDQALVTRHKFKIGNRQEYGNDFRWFVAGEGLMGEWEYPENVVVLERTEWGDFFGFPIRVLEAGEEVAVADDEALWRDIEARIARAVDLRNRITRIEKSEIGANSAAQERLRLQTRRLQRTGAPEGDPAYAEIEAERERLLEEFQGIAARRTELVAEIKRDIIVMRMANDREVNVPFEHIVRAHRPNMMSLGEKIGYYVESFRLFIFGYPREANTEGGIFPAIFGTVIMVILMSIIVTPVGVLAAIYLREYAKQGPFVRFIRICVNNLAGVPSIVFGVFGVGFFVYFLGGNIDQLFFQDALPAPTFGTPGLFWASLTLALLTLPVVIVSTEEGLTRIPRSIREGSLALGATKAETLWKVIVPMSAPAMMTGLILAVARAAGEVAPLMLVGVVKLAPNLPIDGNPPFIHLERQFMHLGFHIYDVGFQSPNVDAARPLVYATALALVVIIVVLNLTAIMIRNRLREKYKSDSD